MAEPTTDTQVLEVTGDVDVATVDALLTRALDLVASASEEIVLDLGGVAFIDSSGLGALVQIRKAAEERGVVMRLTRVPAAVSRVLDLTGLSDVFFADE